MICGALAFTCPPVATFRQTRGAALPAEADPSPTEYRILSALVCLVRGANRTAPEIAEPLARLDSIPAPYCQLSALHSNHRFHLESGPGENSAASAKG